MKFILRSGLNIIAVVGLGIIPAQAVNSTEPFFTTLCPSGFAIGLSYPAEGRRDEAQVWKLFLGGSFAQAEIQNFGDSAQILCYYGGDDPRGPRLQSTGSYRLQLIREGQSCRFVQAVSARIDRLQSEFGGTTTRFVCKGTRDVCVAICD